MSTQVEQFINEASAITGSAPVDYNAPKVPFQTGLRLTADQEQKMIDHAFKRKHQIQNENGRELTMNPIWWNNQTWGASVALQSQGLLPVGDTFMGKRSRYDATYHCDVSWRPFTMGPATIFSESNITVPLSRRIAGQMIAKAKNAFFGLDPWFSIEPQPVVEHDAQDDAARDDKIEKFCRFKLRQTDTKEQHGNAIEAALVFGECAVKTSYVVRDQIFNTEAVVLHGIDGQPVRANDGNFITQEDQFVDAEDGTGRRVLGRDPSTEIADPDAPIWQKTNLDRRQVLFEGARSEVIYYKDFLCPLTASDVQTADTICHLYDKPVMEFVDLVVKRGMVGDNQPERMAAAQKMVALVKQLSENSPQPKAAASQELRPNDHYVSTPSVEDGGPVAEFAEFYLWYDANGDGIAENIMLICDRNTKAPIFYDHVANVTTDGLRPIEIVRINPVQGRWYGIGIIEKFEPYQTLIDLLVNRWNFSQSRAGRVDFWTPTNTLEGDRDPNLKMNWGGTYTAKTGMKLEDCLKSAYLTDIKFDQIHAQINLWLQLAYNESGVMTANDGQAAGSQSQELATGILEVTRSGDELFKPVVQDLHFPLSRLLEREISVTLANLNPVEVFTFLEGDDLGIASITPNDVRGLKYKARITLTNQKNMEVVQMSAQAAALVEKFYMLPPGTQEKVAAFYRSQLRILAPGVDDKVTIVPDKPVEPTPEPTKSGVNLSIKFETLTPEEKQLLLAKIGVDDPNPSPAVQPKSAGEKSGSGVKLGRADTGGASAASPTQLKQKSVQPTGVSAKGGTPAA